MFDPCVGFLFDQIMLSIVLYSYPPSWKLTVSLLTIKEAIFFFFNIYLFSHVRLNFSPFGVLGPCCCDAIPLQSEICSSFM